MTRRGINTHMGRWYPIDNSDRSCSCLQTRLIFLSKHIQFESRWRKLLNKVLHLPVPFAAWDIILMLQSTIALFLSLLHLQPSNGSEVAANFSWSSLGCSLLYSYEKMKMLIWIFWICVKLSTFCVCSLRFGWVTRLRHSCLKLVGQLIKT